MVLFWVTFGLNFLLYVLAKRYHFFRSTNELVIIILILSFSFLVVAIITKDPIFSTFGVPPEFEWIVGLFITGLTSWRLYFNPLKERVIKVERKVDFMQGEISSIKADTTLIKEKVLKIK